MVDVELGFALLVDVVVEVELGFISPAGVDLVVDVELVGASLTGVGVA